MTCRGICTRYRVTRPALGIGRYAAGQKRCQLCEIFLEWDGLICPCCRYRLRLKPRNMKFKIKLQINKKEQGSPGNQGDLLVPLSQRQD
jgi:hypothetical protein